MAGKSRVTLRLTRTVNADVCVRLHRRKPPTGEREEGERGDDTVGNALACMRQAEDGTEMKRDRGA